MIYSTEKLVTLHCYTNQNMMQSTPVMCIYISLASHFNYIFIASPYLGGLPHPPPCVAAGWCCPLVADRRARDVCKRTPPVGYCCCTARATWPGDTVTVTSHGRSTTDRQRFTTDRLAQRGPARTHARHTRYTHPPVDTH